MTSRQRPQFPRCHKSVARPWSNTVVEGRFDSRELFDGDEMSLSQFANNSPLLGGHPMAPRRRLIDHFRIPEFSRSILPGLQTRGPRSAFAESPQEREPLGRLGSLEVRLARSQHDIRRAQRLRFQVFYDEMSATPNFATSLARRDMDRFDHICDHILVTDQSRTTGLTRRPPVVGTYRLFRQELAARGGGLYSGAELAVAELVVRHPGLRFLELGRSCVLPAYRNKRTVELLWHGIWTYVLRHRMDVMIGCASLEGTDPDNLAMALSFLHHHTRAPQEWRTSALPARYVEMKRLPKAAFDPRAAWRCLPPLLKGYLRLGAFVADGAVIDRQFGTTDVLIVLPVSSISGRYIDHFGATADRHAA